MAYKLKEITIRTNNTAAGIKGIQELWQDIMAGKIPILFDSEHKFFSEIILVSKYHNYASDDSGDYDLSVVTVMPDFFNQMETSVSAGTYKKYNADGDDLESCVKEVWEQVWHEQQNDAIKRIFSEDYENTVPAEYAEDGKSHCYLYIAIES